MPAKFAAARERYDAAREGHISMYTAKVHISAIQGDESSRSALLELRKLPRRTASVAAKTGNEGFRARHQSGTVREGQERGRKQELGAEKVPGTHKVAPPK